MKISVIIPSFNRAGLLPRAIRSVLAQTQLPDEVIVVNDGSTDDTSQQIRQAFPQVILIEQDQVGVSAARNAGIRRATGDWIALLDSDDEWLPGKLAAQSAALSKSPLARVCHTEEIWIRNDRRVNAMAKHQKPAGRIYQQCLPLCCVSPSSILIHRSALDTVGLFDETLPACEDYELWLRLFNRYEIVLVPEPQLRKYGGHDDQLSRQFWGMDRFRVKAMEGMLLDGNLGPDDWRQTVRVLKEKCRVLASGADKRGKTAEAEQYRQTANRYHEDRVAC